MPDCQHYWTITTTEPNTFGNGRNVHLQCNKCETQLNVITLKTDDELQTELANQ